VEAIECNAWKACAAIGPSFWVLAKRFIDTKMPTTEAVTPGRALAATSGSLFASSSRAPA
jgi:hypothetical protein